MTKFEGNFDEILEVVGSSGWYQAFVMVLTGLAFFVVGAQNMAAVFTAGAPDFRCVTGDDDVSLSYALPNVTSNVSISIVDTSNVEACEIQQNGSDVTCANWRYSDDVYETSIVTKVRTRCKIIAQIQYKGGCQGA